ncbi:MAG: hypothetical protein GKS01_14230 [Alphaproteobacteria bacterium]|nr:hypothetical protein [Alphaproteobacteria bacterium]
MIIKNYVSAFVGMLCLASVGAVRADVIINYTGSVDNFNSGPFTVGAAITGQIILDETVVPVGVNNTFNNVITSFTFHVAEPGVSGGLTYTGSGGRVQQFIGVGLTEFVSVAIGGVAGGTFTSPVFNDFSAASFDIDFRGADLFGDPTTLATNLTEADFSRSFLTFNFDHPTAPLTDKLMVERALDTVVFASDSVSEPGSQSVFGLGVLALAFLRRSRTIAHRVS